MSKTNYLQAVISDLQRTAGSYRCARSSHSVGHAYSSMPSVLMTCHRKDTNMKLHTNARTCLHCRSLIVKSPACQFKA